MEEGISLCMIVKNEEKYLEECLNSIKELVDEIIIVDTGSTDKTKEIARKFTKLLFDFIWNDNFSDARNFSLSKPRKKWILCLDADEVISKSDCEKIKELSRKNEAEGYIFNFRDYTNRIGVSGWISSNEDKYIESKKAHGYTVSKVLRFFKAGFYFEGRIHETAVNSIKKNNGEIFDSDIVIHHYGNIDEKRYINKKESYINLLRRRIEERDFSEKPEEEIYYDIVRELVNNKEYNEAIIYLKKAIELNEKFEYLSTLGSLYLLEKKYDDAEKTLKKAIEKNPKNQTIQSNLGIVYSEKGELNKAIRKFEKAIELNPKSADSYYNLGFVYKKLGKLNKANEYYEKAIELNPSYKDKIDF